jgi:cell division protein FtsL
MSESKVLRARFFMEEQEVSNWKLSSLIVTFLLLLGAALTYIWSHVHFMEIKYNIAQELSRQEKLLEENCKLKVEIATLKSPQRLETIGKGTLGMQFPERDQVLFLK